MERIMRIKGKGSIRLRPDRIRLLMTQTDKAKEYNETLERASGSKEQLDRILARLGFDQADLKTISFQVETSYEDYQNENGRWERRFVGYEACHRMKLEFPRDNQLLGKILYALGQLEQGPEFSIEYTVADAEAAKSKLLEAAVKDSALKARTLAEASGVKLGEIRSIHYSWEDFEPVARPMGGILKCRVETDAVKSYSLPIETDDIEASDTVTVVWEIL